MSTTSYSDGMRVYFSLLFKVHTSTSMLICRASIRETNPYLVVATCLYIACKMEECPNHIRTVVQEAKQEWAGMNPSSICLT
jgi:cyclin-C